MLCQETKRPRHTKSGMINPATSPSSSQVQPKRAWDNLKEEPSRAKQSSRGAITPPCEFCNEKGVKQTEGPLPILFICDQNLIKAKSANKNTELSKIQLGEQTRLAVTQ